MEIQPDFREWLELFAARRVEFLIVGGYALAFHGAPRFTGDLDIMVKPDFNNAILLLTALNEFGFGSIGLTIEDFVHPDKVVQLGVPPVRVDLITSISGVSWDEAWKSKTLGDYGGAPVFYIDKKHLVINKRATGRKKDLAELEALGEG